MSEPTIEKTFEGHTNQVTCLCFSNDDSKLFSCDGRGFLISWNLKTSEEMKRVKNFKVSRSSWAIDHSPNTNIIATSSRNEKFLKLWNSDGPSIEIANFHSHRDCISCVRFFDNGEKILSVSDDRKMKIWNVKQEKLESTIDPDHKHFILCGIVFNDDKMIASCGKCVKLWDLRSDRLIHSFPLLSDRFLYSIRVHFNSNMIACGGDASGLILFDLRNYERLHRFNEVKNVRDIDFHLKTDGKHILCGTTRNGSKIFDIPNRRTLYPLAEDTGMIRGVKFTRSGRYFATGGHEKRVRLWNTNFYFRDEDRLATQDLNERIEYVFDENRLDESANILSISVGDNQDFKIFKSLIFS